MRERDDVHFFAVKSGPELLANDIGERVFFGESRGPKHLCDCDAPDGENELGLKRIDFSGQVLPAILDFLRVRLPIAGTFDGFSGKATRDGRHVNSGAELLFGDPGAREPLKERLPGRISKRFPELCLMRPGRLPDEKNFGGNGGPVHGRALHLWTSPALTDVLLNSLELADGHRGRG